MYLIQTVGFVLLLLCYAIRIRAASHVHFKAHRVTRVILTASTLASTASFEQTRVFAVHRIVTKQCSISRYLSFVKGPFNC